MAGNLMVIEAMRDFDREFQALRETPVEQLLPLRNEVSDWLSREYLPRIPQVLRPSDTSRLLPRNIASFVLQSRYLVNNPNPVGSKDDLISAGIDRYDAAHARYHEVFRDFLDEFGYYDIFLVEPEARHHSLFGLQGGGLRNRTGERTVCRRGHWQSLPGRPPGRARHLGAR
jgi:methyl-accepting chemotaxis protein